MTRCASCNGIIAPADTECFICGERVPGGAKRARAARKKASGNASASFGNFLCLVSLSVATWSLVSGHRLLLVFSMTLCTVLFFSRAFAVRTVKQAKPGAGDLVERVTGRRDPGGL